jgi:serine beta-lactamase-like protein LACTB, mitochondrial
LKHRLGQGIAAAVILFICVTVVAQTSNSSPRSSAPTSYSREILAVRKTASQIYLRGFEGSDGRLHRPPAFSWAIAVDGKLRWAEAYGFADLEERLEATSRTKFRVGSASKALTSAGLGLLYEQGKLDIDAPIQRYVSEFPDKGAPITVRELAGHLGGIRHYLDSDFLPGQDNQKHYNTLTEGLAIFANDPLVAEPGTKFIYSSYGFNLIGVAIERAAGQNYPDFMHDRVFVPLGMDHTSIDDNSRIIDHRARFYDLDADGRFRNANYIDSSYKWPAGGFLSTPSDLVTFGSALSGDRFLEAATRQILFRTQRTTDGKPTGYAMGWFVHEKGQSPLFPERVFNHAGDIEGGQATIAIFPDYNVVVAFALNTDSVAAKGASTALALAQPFIDAKKAARKR